jgi:hypothetical protein
MTFTKFTDQEFWEWFDKLPLSQKIKFWYWPDDVSMEWFIMYKDHEMRSKICEDPSDDSKI